jgi:L-cysteine desulfidase
MSCGIFGKTIYSRIISATASACDAMCPTDEMVLDIMTHKGC